MAQTIYPQSGDTAGELAFQHWMRMAGQDHVRGDTDFEVTHNTGLDVDIAPGDVLVNGVHLNEDTVQTITVSDNTTNYLYIKLTRDASSLVSGANYTDLTTIETGADYFPLAIVKASSGSVDYIDDMRWPTNGQAVSAFKRTTEQRTSTTLTPDGSLLLPAHAGDLYRLKASIGYKGTIRWALDMTAAPEDEFKYFALDHNDLDGIHRRFGLGETQQNSTDHPGGVITVEGYMDMAGVAYAELHFEWRTNTSGNSATVVAGSSLTLERIE